jgi:acetyltransferase
MVDYPEEYIEPITLKDGRQVVLRPIKPSDAALLQEGFQRLSAESIRMRFLETAKELSDQQAQSLATVDYQKRMAFVGSVIEDGREQLVVSARYTVIDEAAGSAEAAIVVRDDYQGNGLGKITMDRLIRYAATHGVKNFIATIHLSNTRVLNFIKKSGLVFNKKVLEPGTWELTIYLSPENTAGLGQEKP